MVRYFPAFLALCLVTTLSYAQEQELNKSNLSYAIGYQMGRDFKLRNLDVDVETVIQAIRDGAANKEPTVSKEDMQAAVQAMQQKVKLEAKERFEKLGKENKTKGEAFLKENRGKKGIKTLNSGLQYREIEEGTGASPTLEDTVEIHVRGSLIDDREIFSSYAKGQPLVVALKDAMPGWQEALPLMKSGATWQLFIPPELAYAEHGDGRLIGPNETLIFDIKLISIKK